MALSRIGKDLINSWSFDRLSGGRLGEELKISLGNCWGVVEAFRVDGEKLKLVGYHPALRAELRLRKKEVLDHLRPYGISEIKVERVV